MNSSRIFAAEAIGTFIVVAAAVGAVALPDTPAGSVGIGLASGLGLLVAYALIGGTSGGHFNPAVSAGMAMAKRIDVPALLVYWSAQIVGAVVAVFGVLAIARGSSVGFDADLTNFGANAYGHDAGFYSFAAVAVAEVLLTAILVLAYLSIRSSGATAIAGAIPLAAAYALTQFLSASVDGGAANPAKSIATALMARGDALSSIWVFILFPLLGSLLGVLAWVAVDDATLEDTFFDELGLDEARDAIQDAVEDVLD